MSTMVSLTLTVPLSSSWGKADSRGKDPTFLGSLLTIFPGISLPLFSAGFHVSLSRIILLLDLLSEFSESHLPVVFWKKKKKKKKKPYQIQGEVAERCLRFKRGCTSAPSMPYHYTSMSSNFQYVFLFVCFVYKFLT